MPVPLHLYVITGATRGLGAALAEQLLRPGNHLLCLSRSENKTLVLRARAARTLLEQWPQDLARPVEAAGRLAAWLRRKDVGCYVTATLVNNACVLAKPGPVEEVDTDELSAAMRVGLEAPVLLTAAFLRGTQAWSGRRRVVNISSTVGRQPMAGQASYCAVKAGIDHYSRTIALDEARKPNGAQIVALAPGSTDTSMQAHLRVADPSKFPEQQRFAHLKQEGRLASPADAARRVLAYLEHADFGSSPVADCAPRFVSSPIPSRSFDLQPSTTQRFSESTA